MNTMNNMEDSKEIVAMIHTLVQKYPNDYKLGEAVREYINCDINHDSLS